MDVLREELDVLLKLAEIRRSEYLHYAIKQNFDNLNDMLHDFISDKMDHDHLKISSKEAINQIKLMIKANKEVFVKEICELNEIVVEQSILLEQFFMLSEIYEYKKIIKRMKILVEKDINVNRAKRRMNLQKFKQKSEFIEALIYNTPLIFVDDLDNAMKLIQKNADDVNLNFILDRNMIPSYPTEQMKEHAKELYDKLFNDDKVIKNLDLLLQEIINIKNTNIIYSNTNDEYLETTLNNNYNKSISDKYNSTSIKLKTENTHIIVDYGSVYNINNKDSVKLIENTSKKSILKNIIPGKRNKYTQVN